MKEYLNQDEKRLMRRLLDRNTENNHSRIIIATWILVALITTVVAVLKWMGWATPAISYTSISLVALRSAGILIMLSVVMKLYGVHNWSKWVMLSGEVLIFMIMRNATYDAPETHAISYLPILMGLFYFDVPLIIFITLLSIAGDIFLLHIYPSLQPPGGLNALITRYLCYLWACIAAVIGSRAIQQLLQLGIKLKATNEAMEEDIRQKNRLDKMKKEFIAAVSHDLQTPVSLINGYAEGLKDEIVSGQKRNDFVDIIIDEARKMGLLVSNMLDYSQLESGHMNLQEDKFCIVELLRHNIKQFINPISEKLINVDLKCSTVHILVYADPYRIDLVIANILNNALRYTPNEGQIIIRISEDAGNALVEIDNQGEPIPEDSLERIWDPFYRVEQSRNIKYGGTGLGLSIVSTILHLHNSKFGVANTPSGVKFYFTLPTAVE